jgi:hypothetical protein
MHELKFQRGICDARSTFSKIGLSDSQVNDVGELDPL